MGIPNSTGIYVLYNTSLLIALPKQKFYSSDRTATFKISFDE
jgi:hypothetical protein